MAKYHNFRLEKELTRIKENYNMGFICSYELLHQVLDSYQNYAPELAANYIVSKVSEELNDAILRAINPLVPINIIDFAEEND